MITTGNNALSIETALYEYLLIEGAVKSEKPKESEIDDSKIKVVHTMADGTVRNSVEGYEIPFNDTTATAYHLLAKWAAEGQRTTE